MSKLRIVSDPDAPTVIVSFDGKDPSTLNPAGELPIPEDAQSISLDYPADPPKEQPQQ